MTQSDFFLVFSEKKAPRRYPTTTTSRGGPTSVWRTCRMNGVAEATTIASSPRNRCSHAGPSNTTSPSHTPNGEADVKMKKNNNKTCLFITIILYVTFHHGVTAGSFSRSFFLYICVIYLYLADIWWCFMVLSSNTDSCCDKWSFKCTSDVYCWNFRFRLMWSNAASVLCIAT